MSEPTFDADGYPNDATLEAIEKWVILTDDGFDFEGCMDFAGRAWNYPEYWEKKVIEEYGRPVLSYVFSTVGWSGNESIVAAIEKNLPLQSIGAYSWQRGGHYEYRFPAQAVTAGPRTAEGAERDGAGVLGSTPARVGYERRRDDNVEAITRDVLRDAREKGHAQGVAAARAAVEGLRAPSENAAYGVIGYNLGIDAATAAIDRLTEPAALDSTDGRPSGERRPDRP